MELENHTGYELVEISKLKLNEANRNIHPQSQIDRLCKILQYQGWRYPVKVSNLSGTVVSGHGRILSAKQLGITKVPVVYQDYIDEAQEYADAVSDNSIASWSELDLSGINTDLADLGPFDIDLLGIKDFKVDVSEFDLKGDAINDQVAICESCGRKMSI